MNFLYKMERKFGKYAVRNLSLILVLCYAAGYIIELINEDVIYYLTLDPYAIVHGQVWRLVSWVLIPPPESNIFFAIIMCLFCYSIGTSLERTWGTFQYNVYLFSGMIFTVLGSFLMMGFSYLFRQELVSASGLFFRAASTFYSTYYVYLSIFLAYAVTFPNNTVLFMFFIPVQVKWLGIADAALLVFDTVRTAVAVENLVSGMGYVVYFAVGSSMLNFIVFFFTTRKYIRMNKAQRKMHKEFRQHERNVKVNEHLGVPKHRCAVCGRTENDGDNLVFRFCSKCEGNYEYCQDHLYTHVHVTKDSGGTHEGDVTDFNNYGGRR